MWPNPQIPADLVTITTEILNEKLHFLCSDFDLSLSQSIFPDKLKIAKITCIYKNEEKLFEEIIDLFQFSLPSQRFWTSDVQSHF